MSGQAHFQIIPYSLRIYGGQLIQYKNDIFNLYSHKCLLNNSFIGLSKLFLDGKELNNIDFRLKDF